MEIKKRKKKTGKYVGTTKMVQQLNLTRLSRQEKRGDLEARSSLDL